MSKIEEDRKVWEGKSDEWLYERLSNELTDKVAEIHKLIEELKLVKNNVDLANVMPCFSKDDVINLVAKFGRTYNTEAFLGNEETQEQAIKEVKDCIDWDILNKA